MSKKLCLQCGFRNVQGYGTSRPDKPRWHCPVCRRTFVWKNGANTYQWAARVVRTLDCRGLRGLHRPPTGRRDRLIFSDLKRARSLLLAALPDRLHYLDNLSNPSIPKSTNAFEGYFARPTHKYRQHRGLVRPGRTAYLQGDGLLCPR